MTEDTASADTSGRNKLGEKLLQLMAATVAHQVEQAGLDADRAAAIAGAVVDQVRDQYGGQILYIRIGVSEAARQRWQQIWDRFTGINQAELAREFGLSVPQLYRIIAFMRRQERRRRQRELQFEE